MQNTAEKSVWKTTNVRGLLRHRISGVYYSRLWSSGKQRWKSLDTVLKSVAEEKLRGERASQKKLKSRSTQIRQGRMLFSEALDIYRNRLEQDRDLKPASKRYRRTGVGNVLKSWPSLAATDVSRITISAIREWALRYRSETRVYVPPGAHRPLHNSTGVSATTFNCTLDALRHVLDIAVEAGALAENPARDSSVKGAPRKASRVEIPARSKFAEMVAAVRASGSARARPCGDMVELLAYSGARLKEANALLWSDVDFKKGIVTLRDTKNGEIRDVPMCPELHALLKAMHARRQPRGEERVLEVRECQRSIDTACRKISVPRLTHHGLRHLCATVLIESGIDIPTVARILGHKDGGALAMKTYGHLRMEHAQAMMQKVRFGG